MRGLWKDAGTEYGSTVYDRTTYENSEYEPAQEDDDEVKQPVVKAKPQGICGRRRETSQVSTRRRTCPARRGRSSSPSAHPDAASSGEPRERHIAKKVGPVVVRHSRPL